MHTHHSALRSGIFLMSLLAALGLASCGGGGGGTSGRPATPPIPHSTPPQPVIGTIASAVAAAVNTPYLAGNAVQYYCDCKVGAAGSCVLGNDATGAGTQRSPFQTLDAAMTWLNGAANRTAALCQGGSFTSAHTGTFIYTLATNACAPGAAGTPHVCNELREYPFRGTGAKPLITNTAGTHNLFSSQSSSIGWRFMNLKLQGVPAATYNPATQSYTTSNAAFFLYANKQIGTGTGVTSDIVIENLDIDGFDMGIDDAGDNLNNNITVVGNHFTNITALGYLGGSNNANISYNSFVNVGSDSKFDHAIYMAPPATALTAASNVSVVGNYVTGFSQTKNNSNGSALNTTCLGAPIIGHGEFSGLVVSGNVVIEAANSDPGCWGIGFTNLTNATEPIFHRNALFSNNIVVNGGNLGITVDTCPYCVVENNLVITQADGGRGIMVPFDPARPQDPISTNVTVRNNTVYFDTNSTVGMDSGIIVGVEGTGHTISNNTVMYAASTATNGGIGQPVTCFKYGLPKGSYAFIDSNNCFSPYTGTVWESTTMNNLTQWKTNSGFDRNSTYASPGWTFPTPLVIPTWSDATTGPQLFAAYFTPVLNSPVRNAGNAANAPAQDITGAVRPTTPSIGAYQ